MSAATWPTAIAVAVAVGAPNGDWLKSMMKQGVQRKGSGTWLAGAGGLLDRIDSFLIALALVLVLQ